MLKFVSSLFLESINLLSVDGQGLAEAALDVGLSSGEELQLTPGRNRMFIKASE